ncbi:MAG: DUF896 domain-containing protein [Clostridiaceae bacterium]
MDINKTIERINFLYKKSQNEGLTEEEKKEQAVLRKEYIDMVKGNVKVQLNKVEYVGDKKPKN